MKARELAKILEKAPEMDVLVSVDHVSGFKIEKIAVVGEQILLLPAKGGDE